MTKGAQISLAHLRSESKDFISRKTGFSCKVRRSGAGSPGRTFLAPDVSLDSLRIDLACFLVIFWFREEIRLGSFRPPSVTVQHFMALSSDKRNGGPSLAKPACSMSLHPLLPNEDNVQPSMNPLPCNSFQAVILDFLVVQKIAGEEDKIAVPGTGPP